MHGWTMLCKWGNPVATLPMTNGTIRHTRRKTEILRIKFHKLYCTILRYIPVENQIRRYTPTKGVRGSYGYLSTPVLDRAVACGGGYYLDSLDSQQTRVGARK
eukprot:1192347-Pleurochrysis_carterae.AAC.1